MENRFSDKGITVDESKVKAITQMPMVKNVLERFLGLIPYGSRFIPCLKANSSLRINNEKNIRFFGWEMHVSPSAISFTGLVFGLNFLKADMSVLVS